MDTKTRLIRGFCVFKKGERLCLMGNGFLKMNTIMFWVAMFIFLFASQSQAMNKNISNTQIKMEDMMTSPDHVQIEKILKAYFKALRDSNISEAANLYTEDCVFMPNGAPTSVGLAALKVAYGHVFKALEFMEMGFTIDEMTLAGDWAIVRTSSLGTLKVLANNQIIEGAKHREFFVMQKTEGGWKIARYMFNTAEAVKH